MGNQHNPIEWRERYRGYVDALPASAPLADKILRGTPPSEIPAVSADNFIQINYKAARQWS